MSASGSVTVDRAADFGRLELIRELLDSRWRPTEWDPLARVLTLSSDGLRVGRVCRVAGCERRSALKVQLCSTCRRAWVASGVPDPDTWLIGAVRESHLRGRESQRKCAVVACERVVRSKDLCSRHAERCRLAFPDGQPPSEQWLQTQPGWKPRPSCLVDGCDRQSFSRNLCAAHYSRWSLLSERPDVSLWVRTEPIVKCEDQISFAGVSGSFETELLFVLQQRDREGFPWNPTAVRAILRAAVAIGAMSPDDLDVSELPVEARPLLAYARDRLALAVVDRERHAQGDIWDLRVMAMLPPEALRRTSPILDTTTVRQEWLRAVTKRWLLTLTSRGVGHWRDVLRSAEMLSAAMDSDSTPSGVGRREVEFFLADVRELPLSATTKSKIVSNAARMLREIQMRRWVPGLSPDFVLTEDDRIRRPRSSEVDDDMVGRAIPETVIDQLNQHVGLLVGERKVQVLGDLYHTELRRLAYVLFRDTGRRLGEVETLTCACVQRDISGNPSLIYDNFKGKRYGRRLPIMPSLADEIDRVAALVRGWFPGVAAVDVPLFPSPKRRSHAIQSITSIDKWIRDWVNVLPAITDGVNADGSIHEFDKKLITSHAFRHSYAQRLADSGVDPDVLRELMDHTSLEVTQRYYRVSAARRRNAIEVVSRLAVNQHGDADPGDPASYPVEAIAVPYGNCKEPSNVAAGGSACPIRHQCAGCGWYRPDPSYLPAIESHISELLAGRENALAASAASWVLQSIDSEIAAYRQIATTMRDSLERLDPEQRALVDCACQDLRKVRAIETTNVTIGRRP